MSIYPDEDLLNSIKTYDILKSPTEDFIQLIIQNWYYPDYVKYDGKELELHTGGWSGNESIIESLQENYLFWSLCWEKSTRGGHYWFDISRLKEIKKE